MRRPGVWVAGAVAVVAWAQEPVFRGGVELVDLLASVRNQNGALANNLERTDFRIFEDGVEQEIRQFSRQSDLPLTIGMLVDISDSVATQVRNERAAALQFFEQVLREQDRAFVVSFAGQAVIRQRVTNDPDRIADALNNMPTPNTGNRPVLIRKFQAQGQFPLPVPSRGNDPVSQPRVRLPGGVSVPIPVPGTPGNRVPQPQPQTGPRPGPQRDPLPQPTGRRQDPDPAPQNSGGTVLYDAIYLASDDVLRTASGRKVLLLITDGMDTGSGHSMESALNAAIRSDTIIYGIHVRDAGLQGETMIRSREIMETLSESTGGRVFEFAEGDRMKRIFDEIEEELRSQYSISYAPLKSFNVTGLTSGGYRAIEVKLNKPDLTVRTREGYFPRR